MEFNVVHASGFFKALRCFVSFWFLLSLTHATWARQDLEPLALMALGGGLFPPTTPPLLLPWQPLLQAPEIL